MDTKKIRDVAIDRRKELSATRAELESFLEDRPAVGGGFVKSGTPIAVDRVAYARDTLAEKVRQKKDAADEAWGDYIQALHEDNMSATRRLTWVSTVIAAVVALAVIAQVGIAVMTVRAPPPAVPPPPPAPTVVLTCAPPAERLPQ